MLILKILHIFSVHIRRRKIQKGLKMAEGIGSDREIFVVFITRMAVELINTLESCCYELISLLASYLVQIVLCVNLLLLRI